MLAVVGAGLLLIDEPERHVHPRRLCGLIHPARLGHAEHVVAPVDDEEGTLHPPDVAFQRIGGELLDRFSHARGAEHPLDGIGQAVILARVAPQVLQAPPCGVGESGGEPRFIAGRPGGEMASDSPAADGDPGGVHICPRLEIIDAAAHGRLVVVAAGDAPPPERAALAGAVDHQDRYAALQEAPARHEPHLILIGVQAAEANDGGLLFHPKGRGHEIGVQMRAVLIRDPHHLAGRCEMGEKRLGARLHLLEGSEPARIGRLEPEFRTPVVIHSAQPAVARRLNAPRGGRLIPACAVAIAHARPLHVPALVVAGRHAACGLKALAHRAAAFLGFAQGAAKLIGHPGMLGPVVPAVGFVVRPPGFVDPVDRFFFHEKTPPKVRSKW